MPVAGPTLDEQREIVRLYTGERMTLAEVSERVFWSVTAVRSVLVRSGVPTRSRGLRPGTPGRSIVLTREQVERIAELYRSGLSLTEVAARLGVHFTTVSHHLDRAGVRRRSVAEGIALRRCRDVSTLDALTGRQRDVLTFVERYQHKNGGDPPITAQIAVHTRLPRHATKATLYQLERLRLVRKTRRDGTGAGRGRPCSWRRTLLSPRDVFDDTFRQRGRIVGETYLPITPFLRWLAGIVELEERKVRLGAIVKEGRKEGTGDHNTLSVIDVIAARIGIDPRRLLALRTVQSKISLTLADEALLRIDDGTRLEDLWPELAGEAAA
jgi:DNA-binding CsgD family transcriptional regulator